MNTEPDLLPWLEGEDGARFALEGTMTIGRSATANRLVFSHPKVSSRHAVIHAQDGGQFWITDCGSMNGTLVDGNAFVGAVRLRDGARISLGRAVELVFRQEVSPEVLGASVGQRTEPHTHEERRWMLIADLEGFTALGRELAAADLARLVGGWLWRAKDALERHGGQVNKYTGDGFFGYWRDGADAPERVAAGLREFLGLAAPEGMRRRYVLHVGTVAVGGAPSLGEESLMSDALSFTFRMEKVAGALGVELLVSEAAAGAGLAGLLSLEEREYAGEIKGFPGQHRFFSVCAEAGGGG